MTNNYAQFSERIEDLSPEACKWVEEVLLFDFDDPPYEDCDDAIVAFRKLMDGAELTLDHDDFMNYGWPGFEWRIEAGGVGPECQQTLWLYCEEGYNSTHLVAFVQALICKFMSDYVFTLTTGEYCSKPRISEFGGGWLVVHKDGVEGGNTWDAAEKAALEILQRRK